MRALSTLLISAALLLVILAMGLWPVERAWWTGVGF